MLNTEQEKAVKQTEGPLLILAGAGVGKTHTLTERVSYMIKEKGINPESILCVTFTNKAAREMKERIGNLLGVDGASINIYRSRNFPLIGTFHSIGVYFLRLFIDKIGYDKNFTIGDEDDKVKLIKEILDEKNIDSKEFQARKIAGAISGAKNAGANSSSFQVSSYYTQVVRDIFEEYEKKLKQYNILDFDDILTNTYKILQNKEVLDYFQNRFSYFLVDEYQDTNEVQYNIIKLLASKTRNLCVVGDDWQGIYSWRGATIKNILHFGKDYKDLVTVKLEQNYRSTKNIIHCANCVIKNNSGIIDKTLWTDNEAGDKINLIEAFNEKNEVEMVAEIIDDNLDEFKNFGILYRTNGQSRLIEEALLKKGIPYRVFGGLKFYERKEIKDILAYLRLIANPADLLSLKRIINVPGRKIGPKSLETLINYARNYGVSPLEIMDNIEEVEELSAGAKRSISWFKEMYDDFVKFLPENSIELLMKHIIKTIGYEDYLRDDYDGEELEGKLDNLKEFENMASRFTGLESQEALNMFLEEISLITDTTDEGKENIKVNLMTVHLSKGLEFDVVFIIGAEDGIFPHSRTFSEPKELEEERRLMYVAMTRAKKVLYISKASERYMFGNYSANPASRFIREIPAEFTEKIMSTFTRPNYFKNPVTSDFLPNNDSFELKQKIRTIVHNDVSKFSLGDKVDHAKFGIGTIISLSGNMADIAFGSGVGIKKFNIELAPIEKI
ncbi:UvrD-helicase domain-containing protein [Candidatus Gracilibacteria bacterium]|nr:UvrD-helicase domain-containing protein [Candidatus Gracilibacteria bacterium]